MADTLLTLIKDIIKENRNFNLEETNKYKKLRLINNQLYNQFKSGIDIEILMPLFKFYLKDKVLFDSDDYDYILIDVGLKFLNSIMTKLLYLDLNRCKVIDNDYLHKNISKLFEDFYIDFDVITFFEISDNKARIAIIRKETTKKNRKTCKEFVDFPFYNMKIII
jgi:cellulose biosynthesis protein BcsQ